LTDFKILDSNGKQIVGNKIDGKIQFANPKPQVETSQTL
jgi:hypothetical protein